MAHGFQAARNAVNEIKKAPGRRMIVIDPRRTEVADVAELHLQLRPGTDAYLLAAVLAIILRRGGEAADFIAQHTVGWEEVRSVLAGIPIDAWVAHAGVPLADVERAVDMILAAESMVVRVELGIQQSRHSTLNSYLEKLLYLLTGNFGRRGTNAIHTWLQPLFRDSQGERSSVTGQEIIGGLLPTNRFADEVLSDDPRRVRAVWVESNNPANTAADTARFEAALPRPRALGRGRRRLHRDRRARRLRTAGVGAVREVGRDALHLRVAAKLLSPARAALRAARGHAPRARDLYPRAPRHG